MNAHERAAAGRYAFVVVIGRSRLVTRTGRIAVAGAPNGLAGSVPDNSRRPEATRLVVSSEK
jgi:hypothetical protein